MYTFASKLYLIFRNISNLLKIKSIRFILKWRLNELFCNV